MKCSSIGYVVFVVALLALEVQPFLSQRCDGYSHYDVLVDLIRHDKCISMDSVFSHLKLLTQHFHSGSCRSNAIKYLADHFNGTNQRCGCTGNHTFHKYEHDNNIGETTECLQYPAYRELYDQFFINNDTQTVSNCTTHHTVWRSLDQIYQHESNPGLCQRDIVYHISNAIQKDGDPCNCSVDCTSISSYNELMRLADADSCMSVNSVWHLLHDVEVKNHICRKNAQHYLYGKFRHDQSSNCVCNATKPLKNEHIQYINGNLQYCDRNSASYKEIEHQFFLEIEKYGCQDHRHLWYLLDRVRQSGVDCQVDLLKRTAIEYPSASRDPCTCSLAATQPPSATMSTSTITPTNSTTTILTMASTPVVSSTITTQPSTHISTSETITTTSAIPFVLCDKVTTIESVAIASHIAIANSSVCDPDAGGSDDDYTRVMCHLPASTTWRKGMSVMHACNTTQSVPSYTSIASFGDHDTYSSNGGQSGVFVKCEQGGFVMAIQRCNDVPYVVHVDITGVLTSNPYNYYTIS